MARLASKGSSKTLEDARVRCHVYALNGSQLQVHWLLMQRLTGERSKCSTVDGQEWWWRCCSKQCTAVVAAVAAVGLPITGGGVGGGGKSSGARATAVSSFMLRVRVCGQHAEEWGDVCVSVLNLIRPFGPLVGCLLDHSGSTRLGFFTEGAPGHWRHSLRPGCTAGAHGAVRKPTLKRTVLRQKLYSYAIFWCS